jgi:hypothetical protein
MVKIPYAHQFRKLFIKMEKLLINYGAYSLKVVRRHYIEQILIYSVSHKSLITLNISTGNQYI